MGEIVVLLAVSVGVGASIVDSGPACDKLSWSPQELEAMCVNNPFGPANNCESYQRLDNGCWILRAKN